MHHNLRTVLAVTALTLWATASQAKPEYARKENKTCAYCHVNPAGGGARNPRGIYYAMHNHTFDGYDEATVMGTGDSGGTVKKAGALVFKSTWKTDVSKEARRIAVADVTDDKKPRLLVLKDAGKLAVYKLSAAAITKEGDDVDLGANAVGFVVGHFAKGKPAIIAVPGAIFYKNGDTYSKKDAPDLKDISGAARFTDGEEDIFYFSGAGQPDSYGVDLSAAKPLTSGREIVSPDEGAGVYSEVTARLTPEVIAGLGFPEEIQKTGVIGLFDPHEEKKIYVWAPWQDTDGSYIVVLDGADAPHSGSDVKPVWKSPKLTGKVLDAAYGMDPKEGKQKGIYVLQSTGADGKDRLVEFFVLN